MANKTCYEIIFIRVNFLRVMKEEFHAHFLKRRPEIKKRLNEFKKIKDSNHIKYFEEMTFCVFAANSSAKMGLLAVDLLRPVLHKGSLEDYKSAVFKKVRFYNKRAEYLYFNKEKIQELGKDLKLLIEKETDFHERRLLLRDNFKGFGLKESSHFLRNVGYSNYCILDKHIINMMNDLGVLKNNKPPKNENEYYLIEKKIKKFAEENNYDIDELDLALWSFKTGLIIK